MRIPLLNNRIIISRWSIFIIDVLICLFSIFLAYLLRFDFTIPNKQMNNFLIILPYLLMVRSVSFFIFKTYAGVIQHTSSHDAVRIFSTITIGSALFALTNIVTFYFYQVYLFPFSILLIDYFISIFFMAAFRLFIKVVYYEFKNYDKEKKKVVIYGAGEEGIITKKTLERDEETNYQVLAFLDDNPDVVGKKVEGTHIYDSRKGLYKFIKESEVHELIISNHNIPREKKNQVIELCLRYKVKVLNVPPMKQWVNGELSLKQIKEVDIEELLGRPPINLKSKKVRKQLNDKTVLVSGAAGSIGSELVSQILHLKPDKLILVDKDETALYEVQNELLKTFEPVNFKIIVADIRNKKRMQHLFQKYQPQIVYHAAAYKHVPLMEENPSEAVDTNIKGTKILADQSVEHEVRKFVMVSTDKAVNPTNVMGATKRIAEIYVQSLNEHLMCKKNANKTKFITTRFGNVLGSNGSVIQVFRRQIKEGGPVTVTHPAITRYFMTISEACQLVLEAGSMGKGGEIYIFDMGESVKIIDLAKKMIELSGLELGKDIQLVFTGLRPGEKLYEELLNSKENTTPTHHEKIMIADVEKYEYKDVRKNVKQLFELVKQHDEVAIVRKMKSIVPEYVSNNSIYETLDEEKTEETK